ncbi:protein rep [Lacisediminimonas profundi]|uniref:protein rep n=1 Tax=Lacisediminimonas profundi TaxID=2603856 RepID=UPI0019D6A44E|nr:protein rep [Lacisediminimonas profundi]
MLNSSHPQQPASNQLGISGKSTNGPKESTSYKRFRAGLPISDVAAGRTEKFGLLRTAQSLIHDHNKAASEQHRTCWCHRGTANPGAGVSVYRQTSGDSARLQGVTTCKSVWACPVCSARICAARQAELSAGMQAWVGQGGYTWLMTLTFPHERGVPLAQLLGQFSKAKDRFKNSRTYKKILPKGGVRRGSVTSLEVTLGENGWHPHQHDLVFATPDAFGLVRELDGGRMASSVIDELKAAWYMALRKAGLCEQSQMNDVLAHGLDVRGGQYAAEYIAKFGKEQKWGLSREVTMHAAKTGGKKAGEYAGAHPFQLLAWAAEGDDQAGREFREYVHAFEGKRMLSWSPGLKKELTGLDELTDEQAEQNTMPDEERVGRIDSEALSVLQSRRLLGNFIGYVATWCTDIEVAQQEIDDYIEWARLQPRVSRGEVKRKMHVRGFAYADEELPA